MTLLLIGLLFGYGFAWARAKDRRRMRYWMLKRRRARRRLALALMEKYEAWLKARLQGSDMIRIAHLMWDAGYTREVSDE